MFLPINVNNMLRFSEIWNNNITFAANIFSFIQEK